MAIKVGGTTVIDDSRNVDNIGTIKGLTYPSADGTAGQFLKTDGAGNLAFQTVQTDPTLATLTKSFASGESASLSLSTAISTAPVVSVIKEVPQTGVSSKGTWDVAADGANYERHDTAYDTTLTPGDIGYNTDLTYNASEEFYSNITNEHGVRFNNDGTVMYIVDSTSINLREYSLSTAYDPSTATLTNSIDNTLGTTGVHGLHFKPDGTKLYFISASTASVYQYNLSPAWNVAGTHQQTPDATEVLGNSPNTPYELYFKPDGTKLYIMAYGNNAIYEYALSTAWDVTTATYTTSFSHSSQATTIFTFTFSEDGGKMFLASDVTTDVLYEYTLSTPWDVSTASYTNNTFSFGSGETSGLLFEQGGSVLYRVDRQTHRIKVYDVATTPALVLGSGSFASGDVGKTIEGNGGKVVLTAADGSYSEVTAFTDSSTIASGDWGMFGTVVNATDGLELSNIIVDAWDISTATYTGDELNVVPEDRYSTGIFFKPDGSQMITVGQYTDRVYSYDLSTPWDITSATYGGIVTSSFNPGSIGGDLEDIFFKPDGTVMYISERATDKVYQYNLSTAWDITTATSDTDFTTSGQDGTIRDMFISSDGLNFYFVGDSSDSVYQYTLGTAWDISTASFVRNFSISAKETTPFGLDFKSDGTRMFVTGYSSDSVHQYDLSTAWDISTASFTQSFSLATSGHLNPTTVQFKDDGTAFYVIWDGGGEKIVKYDVGGISGPFSTYQISVTNAGGQIDSEFWTDINTMTADQDVGDGAVYYAVSTDGRTTWSVIKDGEGVRPIVRNNAGTWEYNSNTGNTDAWDASVATYTNNFFSVNTQESSPQGLDFKPDGTKMYICGEGGDGIDEYDLSTAWDVTSATHNQFFSTHLQDTQPHALRFKPDGTKMYIAGEVGGDIIEYTLSTAWDISSASYTQNFVISPQPNRPHGLYFRSDGLKMYVADDSVNEVQEYTLSTAWDISTATYVNKISTNSQDTSTQALFFKSDGTKMYVVGRTSDNVYEYALSTAWDVTSATYTDSFSVGSQMTSPSGIYIKADGATMFMTGPGSSTVFEYSIGTNAYTTSTTWVSATTNAEIEALQEALDVENNRMDKTQLDAVTDPNHYTLGNTLDLMIGLYQGTASANVPSSDGVAINYDAEVLNQGAVLGTDYDFDMPDSTTLRVTSNAAQNLKIRVV